MSETDDLIAEAAAWATSKVAEDDAWDALEIGSGHVEKLIAALRASEAENGRLREALEDIARRGEASGRDIGWGHYCDGYAAGKIKAAKTAREALKGTTDETQ